MRVPRPCAGARRSALSSRASPRRRSTTRSSSPRRNQIPYPVIADPELRLGAALRLPTFEVGATLYKRITLVVEACAIAKAFYPVFPPDKNVDEVIAWLEARA